MPDVQPAARRVGEHVEHEQLRPAGHLVGFGQRARRVRRFEGALGLPPVLPAQLDLLGQCRGVAISGHRVVGHRWPKLPARRTVEANLSAQQCLPPFGEAQLERVEREPVPRRVRLGERVPTEVLDGDARLVADRLEADLHFGLLVGREARRGAS